MRCRRCNPVPEDVREELSFHPVMTLDEVLSVALEPSRADALQAV